MGSIMVVGRKDRSVCFSLVFERFCDRLSVGPVSCGASIDGSLEFFEKGFDLCIPRSVSTWWRHWCC